MRGTRRFTLVPSVSVSTSSETGTGLSKWCIGFAEYQQDYHKFRMLLDQAPQRAQAFQHDGALGRFGAAESSQHRVYGDGRKSVSRT